MATNGRHTVTAICYDAKGRILSTATNNYKKTHPLQAYFAEKAGMPDRKFLHAEIAAILKAKTKQIHSISVSRYHANGMPATADPCPVCRRAIAAFGIQEVIST